LEPDDSAQPKPDVSIPFVRKNVPSVFTPSPVGELSCARRRIELPELYFIRGAPRVDKVWRLIEQV